ncbi:7-carboxy-7-deazaguanine synthase QueE [Prochlorococcus marinus]|uniref:7-carboxy-7-deazaguanine synthase n=1 Tax=Prochlorococcus marinus (strain MIT 9211) TaxID=93059 RepID=A9BDE0_PROM4|nr:7-carboxy-7-deazaguanine synthase QueE [Prochlorococcus marinus]ABX09753.1 possible organic radical activating enzyme [Prochlorococcus marinus str. MIT 9211]
MATTLPVVESFHSIQGEGAHAGRSAFFIRLAQCNVGCEWCDTKESWSSISHPKKTIDSLVQETTIAKSKGASFLVITGGEPLHHNLNPLCNAIKNNINSCGDNAIPIHLETSGVHHMSGAPDWITLSPKRHFPPKEELLEACQEIKVIIHSKEDILFAEEMAHRSIHAKKNAYKSRVSTKQSLIKPLLFLQPGWGHSMGQKLAIEYVIKNPQWRLSLQTHKWLAID